MSAVNDKILSAVVDVSAGLAEASRELRRLEAKQRRGYLLTPNWQHGLPWYRKRHPDRAAPTWTAVERPREER